PGSGDGQFGSGGPQVFTFGLRGAIFALDGHTDSSRIEGFDPTGKWKTTWKLSAIQSAPIDHALLSSDKAGNVYLLGRNTGGIYVLDSNGSAKKSGLGNEALQDLAPLALAVDQTGELFVATAEQGILELDPNGALISVIGEGYDQSAPPKLGQLGRPTALALAQDDRLLYVADSGKFPQVVAFGRNGNHAVNVAAGTVDAGKIAYGQTITGQIASSAFIYLYTFAAKSADNVTITMRADPNSNLDPYLELYYQNPGGGLSRLAVNDDARAAGMAPTDAQIAGFHLRFDGSYTIRGTRFGAESGTSTGAFNLSLTLDNAANSPTDLATQGAVPTQPGIRAVQGSTP
ncbi:MAG TPA: hypothetical protein VKQ72_01245, partial [Aggregatilineales bacterium]|nr:hypothetical protein [Aggregatilineales bacterium]